VRVLIYFKQPRPPPRLDRAAPSAEIFFRARIASPTPLPSSFLMARCRFGESIGYVGTQEVTGDIDAAHLRRFITHLLHDLQALEALIAGGAIESGVRRIGAEQDLFLVDRAWRPAPVAMDVLAVVDDPHLTTELGRFNLEINLDPSKLRGAPACGRPPAEGQAACSELIIHGTPN
jgi:hypothetical protein